MESFFNQNSYWETIRDAIFKSSFARWRFACAVQTGGKYFCFCYLINITLLLFITNNEITQTMIGNNISSGYSVTSCDGEIKMYSVLICC